jgi:hypothetical protein
MTGSNFSSWFRADEGSFYSESATAFVDFPRMVWFAGDAGLSNLISSRMHADLHLDVVSNGTRVANLDGGTYTSNVFAKTASSYKVNDFALSLNSGTVATDSSGILPVSLSTLYIGRDPTQVASSTYYLNGSIKKLAYYPKRLQNEELQSLTTI